MKLADAFQALLATAVLLVVRWGTTLHKAHASLSCQHLWQETQTASSSKSWLSIFPSFWVLLHMLHVSPDPE